MTTFILFYRTPIIIYVYHLWGGALPLPISFPFVITFITL